MLAKILLRTGIRYLDITVNEGGVLVRFSQLEKQLLCDLGVVEV